jgi:hypothetical protein
MKKMFATGFCLLFLAACGGSGSAEVACENIYWDGTVGTCLPAEWKVLDRNVLDQRGAPPEVIVAFQAEKPVSGQFPTVTVTREALQEEMTSPQYSEASVQSVTTLPGYEEGDQTKVTVDKADIVLHTFTAQPKSDEPRVRFFQVSVAAQKAGYTYTGAVPLTVSAAIENQIKLILQNATLSDPNAKEE